MKLPDYFWDMSEDEQNAYAYRAGCSIHHLINNIYRRAGPLKQPRPELLVRLVLASEGNVSLEEAIDYFLVQPVRKLAAEREKESIPSYPSMPEKNGTAKKQMEIKDFKLPKESARVGL